MKVLIGTAYFESHRGGIEIVAGRLARALAQTGDAVTWLATDATPAPTAADGCGQPNSISAWNITERRLGFPLPLPGPRGVAAIWRAVATTDALLLHDALYPTNVVAMLAARWHRKPVVLVQHIATVPYENPVLRTLMTIANAMIARPMLRAADQVVFISEAVQRHFAAIRFKAPAQIIFNGVDTELFRLPSAQFDRPGARAHFGLPAEKEVVLFVGRFVEKKGLHIIERLARQRPDQTFALAGWGAIDPNSWRLPNVHVLSGLQGPSLVPLYQASDALLLPSVGEGLPLVLQEALACGLPVVCGSETAAADQSLEDLVAGVTIDASDHESTASAFGRALDRVLGGTVETRNKAARARHAHVASVYSWADAARTYGVIMKRLARIGMAPIATPAARTS
jgi:glycosyltransferase involved in cell wall biosynthesis